MVSPAPSVVGARLARWPFVLLVLLLPAALWLCDTHQPVAWPDAASAWFGHVRAFSPAAWPIDQLNARASLGTDVPLGSALVLLATLVCVLATLLAIDVPAALAIAVAVGLAATRSLWSTVASGHDAVPIALVAGAVAVLARPTGSVAWPIPALGAVAFSPASTWLILPALLALQSSTRRRLGLAIATAIAAIGTQLYLLRAVWTHLSCLAPSAWTSAIGEGLRAGVSADVSPLIAIRHAAAVLAGDVHLFGIAVAAFGLAYELPGARRLRGATLAAIAVALVVVAAGVLPPAFAAGLLLPWWAPWFGVGLAGLVRLSGHREPRLVMAFAVALATLLPVLRHAIVVPDPWRSGMPATIQAVSQTWHGGLVASDDTALTRRLRVVGVATVPADVRTLAACVASGRDVFAIGSTVDRVRQLGYGVIERPLQPSLAAVIEDLRANQLIALAIAPGAISWAGPAGFSALARIGVARDTPASTAIAIVARTDRGSNVRTGRQGVDLTWQPGDPIGGRQLLAPLSVSAHDGDANVDSAPARLVTGRHAAIAVFDRNHEAVLKGVGAAAPGLPIALTNQAEWRNALIRGHPQCIDASTTWTALPASMSRLSVPVSGATPTDPTTVLLASDAEPHIMIDGRPVDPMFEGARLTVFDRQSPADVSRLRETQRQGGIPEALPLRGRWLAQIELHSRGASHVVRTSITPGVVPAGWLVRRAAAGSRPDNVAVCEMVSSERILLGQSGVVDDETAREIAVTIGDGWHAPERVHGAVFQWSAAPTVTATFVLDRPVPLVLAMDATGASTPAGRQALAVRVNDYAVSGDWPGAGRATLPVATLRAGTNTITLSVPQVVRPGRDPRALGVLVRQLRLITAEAR